MVQHDPLNTTKKDQVQYTKVDDNEDIEKMLRIKTEYINRWFCGWLSVRTISVFICYIYWSNRTIGVTGLPA